MNIRVLSGFTEVIVPKVPNKNQFGFVTWVILASFGY